MMQICPKCHDSVEFSARMGTALPHKLESGVLCGGVIDRISRSLAPERTTSPLARLVDRAGHNIGELTFSTGAPIRRVIRWLPPLAQVLETEPGATPMLTFFYEGVVTESGETFHRYTEGAPGEFAAPDAEQYGDAVITTHHDGTPAPHRDLAEVVGRFLKG